jgi:hypothetical protein
LGLPETDRYRLRERKALQVTAIEWLKLGVEQYLRELDDVEYRELIAVARPPANFSTTAQPNS